ncbi:low temperature-induced protein [Laspinema sp. A4]|uniref:low temperature-induced protein n=1 Tax=Laspinema sp. D2d TaxID=2953686 RepID=UPI0021BB0683|nr:low temperature-induced protein [Laspinema sp. D2d]MCT7982310.1 low temperature-induced protein [Laspinema sp. D2d]
MQDLQPPNSHPMEILDQENHNMPSISLKLPTLRPLRFLLAVCVSALLFFTSAFPAYATTSSPTKGEDQMLKIEKKSLEAIGDDPYTLEDEIDETNPGLNGVQGAADQDKMISPADAKADGATSFIDQVKNSVENITGKD